MMPDFKREWFKRLIKRIKTWADNGKPLDTRLEEYQKEGGDEAVAPLIEEAVKTMREAEDARILHPYARAAWLVALKRDARNASAGRRFLWATGGAGGRIFHAYEGHELVYREQDTKTD